MENFSNQSIVPKIELSTEPSFIKQPLIFIYSILFALGLCNALVIVVIITTPVLRTVSNMQVFNLCLSSLIYILSIPFVIHFMATRSWAFGPILCKFVFGSEMLTKYASICFIMLASIERCLAVCFAHLRTQIWTANRAAGLSIFAWILAAALVSPVYLYVDMISSQNRSRCKILWPDWNQTDNQSLMNRQYLTYTFVALFLIPSCIILGSYFMIVRELLRLEKRFSAYAAVSNKRESSRKGRLSKTGSREESSIHGSSTKSNYKRRQSASAQYGYKKVTQSILALVLFYMLCWTPFWVLNLLSVYGMVSTRNSQTPKIIFQLIHILPYLNCAFNPFLYGFMTENFKEALSKNCLVSKIKQKCSSSSSSSSASPRQKSGQAVIAAEQSLIEAPKTPERNNLKNFGSQTTVAGSNPGIPRSPCKVAAVYDESSTDCFAETESLLAGQKLSSPNLETNQKFDQL